MNKIKNINITSFILYIFIFLILFNLSTNCFANDLEAFSDINNHWAKEDIEFLLKNKVINGYEDATFRPNQTVRLAEFLKILIELSNTSLEIKQNLWPDSYMATAIKNYWIIKNDEDNALKNLTRYKVVEILGNYIGLEDVKKSKNEFVDLDKDKNEVVLKLVSLEIINGYSDKTFRGEKEVTRAEACKMIKKAYEAKQNLILNREYSLTSELTNIGLKDSSITNRYEINNNRIYIYDDGRYASLNGQTLNQEYIDDKMVIEILKVLVDEDSYTELKFVPDKYIINSLNILYGKKVSSVLNGMNSFQIRFYENAYYDVAKSKNENSFMKDAFIKIKLGKMWELPSEMNSELASSEKNLAKLEAVIGVIFGDSYKEKVLEYIVQKRLQAGLLPDSEEPKIVEVKKFGKYTINVWCIQNQELEIFIKKF